MAGLYGSADAVAALTLAGQKEIDYLFGYLANSRCEFYRNGTWYDSTKAEAHLRGKYGFLKFSVNMTEDFIEKVASRSSLTGKPYQVRCGLGAPLPSSQWLMNELMRYRLKPGPS